MPAERLEDELAAFGPFFAVECVDGAPGPPWRPVTELVTDPGVLRARVLAVRAVLAQNRGCPVADVELRVAASTAHLGLVARLVAPIVAAAALGGRGIDVGPAGLWWQDRLGVPVPLAVRTVAVAADEVATRLPGTAVEALTTATEAAFHVSPRVLWGNAGSAANTAARLVAATRPDLAAPARAAADALLADRRVDGGTRRSGRTFRRHSCCLLHRLPGTAFSVCEDCVLRR